LPSEIIFIGARLIVTPLPAARDFGVPASDTDKVTYFWTKGTRDIVSGLLVIGLLWLKVSPAVLAAFFFIASLIPFGDLINVYVHAKTKSVAALMMHGCTAVFLCIQGAFLLRR
jgi:hypothetical protein